MDQDPARLSDNTKLWQGAMLAFACLTGLLGILYWESAADMAVIWWNSQSYNHCILVVAVVVIMVFMRRRIIAAATPQLDLRGMGLALLASTAWLLGWAADANVVQHASVVVLFQASVLTIFGWEATRRAAFPLFYLFFAVPVGDFLVAPLQSTTADIVVAVLRSIDIPVYREGYLIQTPKGDFHVAEACAGLRYLISFIALSVLLAGIFFLTTWKRLVVIGLGVLVPIAVNMFRATAVVLTVYYTDHEYGAGEDHVQAGRVLYAVILLAFIFVSSRFAETAKWSAVPAVPGPSVDMTAVQNPPPRLGVFLAIIVAFTAAPLYAVSLAQADRPAVSVQLEDITGSAAGWKRHPAIDDGWSLKAAEAEKILRARYARAGSNVDVAASVFHVYRPGIEVIGGRNRVFQVPAWSILLKGRRAAEIYGESRSLHFRHANRKGERRVAVHWYWLDDDIYVNPMRFKIARTVGILLGRQGLGGIVAVSTETLLDSTVAIDRLHAFLAHLDKPGKR